MLTAALCSRGGLAIPRLRPSALEASALASKEPADECQKSGKRSLPDLPALPAVLLLLGNAVLTKDGRASPFFLSASCFALSNTYVLHCEIKLNASLLHSSPAG